SVLVMGGDMTGKAVIPICRQSDGSHLAHDAGTEVRLQSEAEVTEFSRRVSDRGFYPSVMTEDEFRALSREEKARHGLFKRLVCERVAEWCDYAGTRLKGTGVRFITAPGNDDFLEIDEVLKAAAHVEYHEMEITELEGYEVLHCGGSTRTPWDT